MNEPHWHPWGLASNSSSLLCQMITKLRNQMHRRQQLTGIGGRAYIRAASAFHASVQIKQLLLIKLLNAAHAERFCLLILQIKGRQLDCLLASSEPNVDRGC